MPGAYGRPAVLTVAAFLLLAGVPWAGEVRVTARPGDTVTETFLLERTSQAKYLLARVTPASSGGAGPRSPAAQSGGPSASAGPGEAHFSATGLPPGSYDLVLLTTRGRVEGVNLKVSDAKTQRRRDDAEAGEPPIGSSLFLGVSALKGAELRGPQAPEGSETPPVGPALSDKDLASIRKLVLGMTSFADRRRILFLEGSGTEARALVEELTTRKTSLPSPVPFVVWRVEVWFYRKEFGAWDRYDSRVMARERLPVTEFEQTTWVFDPALGGLRVPGRDGWASEAALVVEVAYEVPQEFDPAHGLVAGKQSASGAQSR